MLDADIFVLVTPIWMGQPSSVAKMVLERLDAELSETDDEGRQLTFGKVAAVGRRGQRGRGPPRRAPSSSRRSTTSASRLPAQAVTYWVGEAMQAVDYQDLDETPEKTAGTTEVLARHATHLARLLKESAYPAGELSAQALAERTLVEVVEQVARTVVHRRRHRLRGAARR